MIYLFSGTPGSGKSLQTAREIYLKLRRGGNVIANFGVNVNKISNNGKKKIGKFTYVSNADLTVNYLINYSKKNHIANKENQTLVVIDEAQVLYNSRSFNNKDRLEWITFFSQHRKLGYNIILVAQMDRMLDRQIRGLIETEYKFRKINNFKFGKLLPTSVFIAVEYWYGINEKVGSSMFTYSRKYGNLYDTFALFS